MRGPMEVGIGVCVGIVWGLITGFIPHKCEVRIKLIQALTIPIHYIIILDNNNNNNDIYEYEFKSLSVPLLAENHARFLGIVA